MKQAFEKSGGYAVPVPVWRNATTTEYVLYSALALQLMALMNMLSVLYQRRTQKFRLSAELPKF